MFYNILFFVHLLVFDIVRSVASGYWLRQFLKFERALKCSRGFSLFLSHMAVTFSCLALRDEKS